MINFFCVKSFLYFSKFCKNFVMYISKNLFNDRSFEMYFFREFWRALMLWNLFFEGTILMCTCILKCIFWGSNLICTGVLKCIFEGIIILLFGCCFILSWLLISVAADLYFSSKFSPQVKILQNWLG